MVYFQCLCFLSSSLCFLPSLFLKNPGDGDPLGIFRNRFQGSLDRAVGLVQVVVDDAEVKVVTIGCLYFSALVARPVQLFILRQKTRNLVLHVLIGIRGALL